MRKFLLALFISFICISCVLVYSQTRSQDSSSAAQTSLTTKMLEACITMSFRYLITGNYQVSPNTRRIEVFLDEKAFSEENLKTLFRYLSDKNPDPNSSPNNLTIVVNTDWKQLDFPSDCPPSGFSGGNSGTDAYDYHWARFHRREGKEFFTYNPKKKEWKNKDVIMKGNKIFRNGQWQEP